VLHLSQVVASALTEDNETPGAGGGNGATPGSQGSATFHDPCRLGRHLGVYDAPRTAMRELGIDVLEMPRNREFAECCGTNGWSHCGAANKHIQTERLREAKATGAEVLVTACLKCQIHFRCALQDRQMGADTRIEIRDLSTMLADALDRHAEAETEHAGIEGE
jgi:Fe-S oxidoreductase